MRKWEKIKLGEICTAKSGNSSIIKGRLKNQNDGTLFPAFSATGQDVFHDSFEYENEAIIVSAVGARCGKCFLASGKWSAIANTHIIFPKHEKVNIRFLWYLINDERFWEKGGTAQPFVKVNATLKKEILLPPLTEQARIARLLDEADALRRLRARADERMAACVPALFHEMFGDSALNNKRWPIMPLDQLASVFSDGPFGSNLKTSHYTKNGIRVVRLQNIGVGEFMDNDQVYISLEHFQTLSKHKCLPNDVIVGALGDPNLRACILPEEIPIALNKADCIQIRALPDIATSEYICWL